MTSELATYALVRVRDLIVARRYRICKSASLGAEELGLEEADILECVLSLDASSFYKSMESEQAPGLWQDVYRPRFQGFPLYVKVQLAGVHQDEMVVVISFKRR